MLVYLKLCNTVWTCQDHLKKTKNEFLRSFRTKFDCLASDIWQVAGYSQSRLYFTESSTPPTSKQTTLKEDEGRCVDDQSQPNTDQTLTWLHLGSLRTIEGQVNRLHRETADIDQRYLHLPLGGSLMQGTGNEAHRDQVCAGREWRCPGANDLRMPCATDGHFRRKRVPQASQEQSGTCPCHTEKQMEKKEKGRQSVNAYTFCSNVDCVFSLFHSPHLFIACQITVLLSICRLKRVIYSENVHYFVLSY